MSQVTAYPTTTTDDGGGSFSWANVTGVNADGGAVASAATNSFPAFAAFNYIKSVGLGFSIPSDITISGIVVEIERNASANDATHRIKDLHLHLLKAGSEVGDDKADTATFWLNGYNIITYGSSSDLWGTTWTPAQINASDFGMRFQPQGFASPIVSADIDFFRITVYYNMGTGSLLSKGLRYA